MSKLGELTASFEQYYQDKLLIPYGENVVYIHTTPTSKKDSWLFVSYPSIVAINHDKGGLSSLLDEKFKPFIAHELAHYYFGDYRTFNSELGDMFHESFSEYLALKLTRQLIDDKTYFKNINEKLVQVEGKTFAAIKDIKNTADYGNRNLYVYTYVPVIWLAIEKEIGEEQMWQWLHKMLTVKTEQTDYTFMIKTLASVIENEQLDFIEKTYLSHKNAVNNAKAALQ